ncbi:SAG family member [Eimeria brunetti]|uniref:SAG family member n=1 Tax=Eimeria brunetti TaxID=51314 RepID=U6LKY6_9EIME|nr:SAG family member [Eimeria brunetti]
MKRLGSVLLAAAVLGAARAENNDSGVTQKGKADTADCLAEFNKVRAQAALDPFTAEAITDNQIPISDSNYIGKGEAVGKTATPYARTGTYAYAPQTGSTTDCSAAVSFWKGAHANFQALPSEYKSDTEGLYADSKNRSLVALFNPNESATIHCAYFTCPIPTTTTTTPSPTTDTPTQPEGSESTPGAPGRQIPFLSEGQPADVSARLESRSGEPADTPDAFPTSQKDENQN